MKNNIKLASLVALAFILINNCGVIAQSQTEEEPLQTPQELEQLEFFQGTWRVEETVAGSSSPPKISKSKIKQDLNNFWYIGSNKEIRSQSNPNPKINGRVFLGYNTSSQRFIRLTVLDNGDYINMTSTGWEGNQLVWEGTLVRMGQSIPLRQTITKESESNFVSTYSILNENNGEWEPTRNQNYARQSKNLSDD